MIHEIDFEDFKDETIIREVDIITSSIFDLEIELKKQSKLEAKYLKAAKEVNLKVAELTYRLECEVASIMGDIREKGYKGKIIPPSAWQEARRTIPPLIDSYKEKRSKLIKVTSDAQWINGLFDRIVNRGYRLKYLIAIEHNRMFGNPTVSKRDLGFDSLDDKIERASEMLNV